ncbi:MAG: hypothetical protein KBD53_05555 [Candidatus Omnitrophica bacterium]|nr:hypothetical protein [Candidatus Omnitrophota bacterium]
MDKKFSIFCYISFVIAIIATTLFYAPGWGLMDDSQNLNYVVDVKNPIDALNVAWENIMGDIRAGGINRPIYNVWLATMYPIFKYWPTGFYILLAILNMLALLLWGIVFTKIVRVRPENRLLTIFLYPLSFFIFTPFWNIFTYLSLQEKFVVWFVPASYYFFIKTYEKDDNKSYVYAFLFMILALMGKPTALFISITYIGFSVLDLVIYRINQKQSIKIFISNAILAGAYLVFTFMVQLRGGYVSRYKEGLSVSTLFENILGGSIVIKGLLVIGLIGLIAGLILPKMKKQQVTPYVILIPMGLLLYIGLLAPWGFRSYLLCALAPLLFGTLFPLFNWIIERNVILKRTITASLAILVAFVFVMIISPSISRMGDINQVIQYMKREATTNESNQYFLPPPYSEPAFALKYQTGEKIEYLDSGILSKDQLNSQGNNYLLLNNLAPTVLFSDVRTEKDVFSNKTWRIIKVVPEEGTEAEYTIKFEKNFMKQFLLKLRDS